MTTGTSATSPMSSTRKTATAMATTVATRPSPHADHADYVHGGHRHAAHEGLWDENCRPDDPKALERDQVNCLPDRPGCCALRILVPLVTS
jgi:hypothetical protein